MNFEIKENVLLLHYFQYPLEGPKVFLWFLPEGITHFGLLSLVPRESPRVTPGLWQFQNYPRRNWSGKVKTGSGCCNSRPQNKVSQETGLLKTSLSVVCAILWSRNQHWIKIDGKSLASRFLHSDKPYNNICCFYSICVLEVGNLNSKGQRS